ncbi:MAG: hypothetical protein B7X67_25935 [Rhizobiales bacterium 39-66-18]|nr:MAG: hypothetical protein B7X67_25935 [Rhizobiales bacterium 39-66-18]
MRGAERRVPRQLPLPPGFGGGGGWGGAPMGTPRCAPRSPWMTGRTGDLLGGSAASAQTSAVIVTQPSGYVTVTPDQQVLIQSYVVQQPVTATVVTQPGFVLVPGAVMPEGVQMQTFSTDVTYGGFDAPRYRYVVMPDNGTVLVEPGSRRIIEVIR